MIDGTFAFVKGLGPVRERELFRRGIRRWEDFPAAGTVLSEALDQRVREGVSRMRTLEAQGRVDDIAQLLPARERWRLYPRLAPAATYLDIETTMDGRPTVIGLYDEASGPRLYVRGHNLGAFLDERLPGPLVTFNGLAFDVPMLRRAFPGWTPPGIHFDLRLLLAQLGERGGLKAIEERLGFGRPDHLQGTDGLEAVRLWDRFRAARDTGALWKLLEYNLYDVVQLRSLAEIACGRLSERGGRPWRPEAPFRRGDVLLDLTRSVESVVREAARMEPDAIEDAERRAIRGF